MPGVLQASLQRGRDVSRGSGCGVGPGAAGGGGRRRDRRHSEARGKPANRQRPLVLAPPLTQLQTAPREEEQFNQLETKVRQSGT